MQCYVKRKKNSINLVLQNIKMIVKSCPTIPLTSHPFIIIDVNGIPLGLALKQRIQVMAPYIVLMCE